MTGAEELEFFKKLLEEYWEREEDSQARLLSYTKTDYREVLMEMVRLVELHSDLRGVPFHDMEVGDPGLPEKVIEFDPVLIRIDKLRRCFLFLNKSMDDGVGYLATETKEGIWELSAFRHTDGSMDLIPLVNESVQPAAGGDAAR